MKTIAALICFILGLALAVACLYVPTAKAVEGSIVLGGWSYHAGDKPYNQDHNIVGYQSDSYLTLTTRTPTMNRSSWWAGKR